MSKTKVTKCPHCDNTIDIVDVCPHCGFIINSETIKAIPSPASINAKPNILVLVLLSIMASNAIGVTIWGYIHALVNDHLFTEIYAVIAAGILCAIIFFVIIRYAYIKIHGERYTGYVYGYIDDEYEGDNQTREQICCIVYEKAGRKYSIKQSYPLGHRKIFDKNDRPYIPGTKMHIITHDKYYICKA